MSQHFKQALLALTVTSTVAGCATTGAAQTDPATAQMGQVAANMGFENAALPFATQMEIEQAERADPLTRVSFWSGEFEKDPTHLNNAIAFVKALRGIQSYERAEEIAGSTAVIHPMNAEIHRLHGQNLVSIGQVSGAVDAYKNALLIDSSDAASHAGLGLALTRASHHEDAQLAYSAALSIDPMRAATRSNYGMSLALTGRLAEGIEQARRAVALEPSNMQIASNLSLLLGMNGNYEEMRSLNARMPAETVRQNEAFLREMMGPSRDWGQLAQANAVPDRDSNSAIGQASARAAVSGTRRPTMRGSSSSQSATPSRNTSPYEVASPRTAQGNMLHTSPAPMPAPTQRARQASLSGATPQQPHASMPRESEDAFGAPTMPARQPAPQQPTYSPPQQVTRTVSQQPQYIAQQQVTPQPRQYTQQPTQRASNGARDLRPPEFTAPQQQYGQTYTQQTAPQTTYTQPQYQQPTSQDSQPEESTKYGQPMAYDPQRGVYTQG